MEITIYAVTVSEYDANERRFNQLDAYTRLFQNEEEAMKAYKDSKEYLVEKAGDPEKSDGSFPGEKFIVETSRGNLNTNEDECEKCEVRRVTDRPEALYKGMVTLYRF